MACLFCLSVLVSLYTLVNPLDIRTKVSSINYPLFLASLHHFFVFKLPSSNVFGPT